MCLNVTKNSRKKTAKKDIVVYKTLERTTKADESLHGKDCMITFFGWNDNNCAIPGKIAIKDNCRLYLCTNDIQMDGAYLEDKLGYEYSWALDDDVLSVIVDGEELLTDFKTPYKNFPVKMGETYESEFSVHKQPNNLRIVEKGLHSYVKPHKPAIVIAKCIIPKGSQYYVGTFSDREAYASNKLKYIEIIKG